VDDEAYLSDLHDLATGLPVEFHTNVDDIAPFYRQADLVLFPTLMEEGFGLTAAEALACGKPVIHSDYPAIREATGGLGIPVPIGDVTAFAREIAVLLEDPERRTALARAGRAYAEANYDWADVYLEYRRVLSEIALDQ
jgi:glycosyltransferase involved in cell wall biosynthesis